MYQIANRYQNRKIIFNGKFETNSVLTVGRKMTLYQKLQNEMEGHREFWNYYGVNFEDVFQDEGTARDFIYNYFKGGSKLYALDTWANSMNEYLQMRNVHTVNVFFIGHICRE